MLPEVDEMLAANSGEALYTWPENFKAAVCLTHDVDRGPGRLNCLARDVWYGLKWLGGAVRGNQRSTTSTKKYFSLRKAGIDPYDNLMRWMELEDSLGVRSAFYFMSLTPRHLLGEGNRYVMSNPAVRRAVQEMHTNQWEVGLHARYHKPFSKSELMEQKNRLQNVLGQEVGGVRNHYLRVRFPESWYLEADCGFDYSSNVGWADTVGGFRSGTCWPYQPVAGSQLWEVPFQMMDSFDLSPEADAFLGRFRAYLAMVKKHRGVFVLDFHSIYFFDDVAPQVNHVYRVIVQQIRADPDLWITTPNQVIRHLNSRLERKAENRESTAG
jgi:peptidoglycan/xylan/chitin deacetylase (PgdA/CDA1 family)